jgi:hypothetical protein
MMQKFWKTATLTATAALVLVGCATTVTLRVSRTPTLDTSGIRRVAVMPFETTARRNILLKNAAQHATAVAADRIRATNNFTLVSPTVIEPRRSSGQNFDDLADALFIGQITHINESTTTEVGYRTDKTTGEKVEYTYYVRDVEVGFTYSFVLARDGTVIGPVTKTGHANNMNENAFGLVSVETLVKRIIDSQMNSLYRDIAPYTVTISRALAKETNKALRPQAETALMDVKAGNYKTARDAYLAIYETHKSIAAAENASILFEALGETETGADFMQRVLAETGNPRARNILDRLNRELRETAKVSEFKNPKSQTERVAGIATDEVLKHLPDNARVWIINNSATENALINNVIDNMTAALLQNGITVVDRQNTALIQAEQAFQMSGDVSDDDIVKVGHTAGANKIIIASISGTGAIRRLQIRVLDVEKGTLLMQSDASDKWGL